MMKTVDKDFKQAFINMFKDIQENVTIRKEKFKNRRSI